MAVKFSGHRQPSIQGSRGGHKQPTQQAGPRPKRGRGAVAMSGPAPTMPGMKGSGVVPSGVADTGLGSGGTKVKTGGIKKAL